MSTLVLLHKLFLKQYIKYAVINGIKVYLYFVKYEILACYLEIIYHRGVSV